MRFKLTSFLLIGFFLLQSPLFAQKAPIKWGKVSEEDLKMTVYEQDSAASAVILCDYGTVQFDLRGDDFQTEFEHHKRIKILKEGGYRQADIEIPYYKELESVIGLKAQVILPDGKKLEVSKKDIFTEEVTENWSMKKIAFPGIVPGAIIEYKYKINSERLFELREWYFEYDIPVRWSEFRTSIPEWYDYLVLNQGTIQLNKEYDHADQTFAIRVNQRIEGGIAQGKAVRSGIQQLSVRVNKVRYTLENIPALYPEGYITTMDDYRTRLRFQLQAVQFPNSTREPVLSTWPKLAERLTESSSFGLQYLKKRNFKSAWKEVQSQLGNYSSEKEKVNFLYQFVIKNIKWNDLYSMYVQTSLNDCYKKKQGYSGELNLMLLGLLKEAGITAYPILISTRGNGKVVQIYPIVDQFNHVIVYASVDGKEILMDASDPHRPMNYLKINALNSSGWLVDAKNPQWVNIVPQKGSETMFSIFTLDEEGTLQGDMKVRYEGYSAITERGVAEKSKKGEHWKKELTALYPDANLVEIKYEGLENVEKPLTAILKLELPEVGQVSGDFIYLNPTVYTGFDENPFKIENRTYPVDIPYPIGERNIVNIEIPEGYLVEELPEAAKIALPGKAGSFQYVVSQKDNTIQLVSRIRVDKVRFEPEEYTAIRSFFEMIIEKQSEQIILKKKT